MSSSIYVATAEAHCGKSLVCLGIMEKILRKTERVAIFRPIISGRSKQQRDKNIELVLSHFNLNQDYEDTYAFLRKEARELVSQGQTDQLLDKIIQKYKALESQVDFILCEGTDYLDEGSAFEFNINVEIVKNLGCPVLVLGRGDLHRSIDEILSPVQLSIESFLERGCQVVSTIINRAQPELAHELLMTLRSRLPVKDQVLAVIPENIVLKSPTVREIMQHLDAKVLYGEDHLNKQVYRYSIAAMQLQNYLPNISENCMVITPGDRGDIILSALEAHKSQNYPPIAAILLTTTLKPGEPVMRLLDGLPHTVPILSVDANTYNTAMQLNNVNSYITPGNQTKINLSLSMFEKYVDGKALEERIANVKVRGLTPRMFQYMLMQKARVHKKHIVLPEGNDERILRAAEFLLTEQIVDLTLLGNEEEVTALIQKLGLHIDISKISIINPATAPRYKDYVDKFIELRKHKGVNKDMAKDALLDVSYFGTMMVLEGDADGMVSGAAHTTQHTIRPALQVIKTKPGFSIVSSVFFMCLPDRVLVYGDCAINPDPDAAQLAEIAIASADTAQAFDIEPKIAMLSYSSGESGQGADVDKVREATQIVKERRPDLKVEGPIQYDAAVDKDVGIKKIPGSEVAGYANVLIFPDLNTGNNTYKAVQRETGAIAIGPVIQGLNKPVNDLSRGCTVPDIINTVIITSIQAQTSEQH